MPYILSRPYLKDRREPFAGPDKLGYAYVAGRSFDYTTLSDDAYGNRRLEPGMLLQWNSVAKLLEPWDYENGSPTYEPVGICPDFSDIRNGNVATNPVNKCKAIASRCWCVNTGGSSTTLTGSDLVTAVKARIAAGHYEMINVEFE